MTERTDFAFLHGGGQGSWVWDSTIAALLAHGGEAVGETLALDVPGCGMKRARDTTDITVHDIVDELVADIDAAGLSRAILVGHSQAGSIMPNMARKRPDLIGRLIYVSCSIPLPGQTVLEMIGSGAQGENADQVGWPIDPRQTSDRQRNAAMFASDMDAAASDAFLGSLGHDQWPMASYSERDWRYDGLESIPSIYVKCLRDRILPPEWQDRFAERFRCDRIIDVNSGHQLMTSRPDTLTGILLDEAGQR